MKASLVSWVVFVLSAAAALGIGSAKPEGGFLDNVKGAVKSCDDFDQEEDFTGAEGVVTFLRPLLCEKPSTFNIYNETVVRSCDSINTTNVHFLVHPEGTLTITAWVIVMRRDEVFTKPVVKVFGRVKLEARAWTPAYVDGKLEDNGDVVRVVEGGALESNQPVKFTDRTFVVASEQACHYSERTVKLSPWLEARRNKRHGRPTAEHHPSDSSGGTGTGISSVSSDSGYSGGSGTEDGDDAHVDSGVQAARHATKKLLLHRNLTTDNRASKSILDVFRKVKIQQDMKSTASSNLLKGSALHHPLEKHAVVCPRDPRVKRPTWALQFGESLPGTLRSAEGRSALRPAVDGSLCSEKKHQAPALSDDGSGDSSGPGVMHATTLLSSDPETARKVSGMLKRTFLEGGGKSIETATKKDTIGGWLPRARRVHRKRLDNCDSKSGKKHETAGGWLPWARRPKRNISDNISDSIAREPANPGEVCLSPSNKACAKVKVDGTTVPPKSGRLKWDWVNHLPWIRPTGDGYQVHVTETGLEIRLGGRTVWGVDADDWMD